MPLYACNGSAGTQRCRCTSATGPLGRSGVIVRVQRLFPLNLRLHAVISFIQIIHLEAQGRELPSCLTAANATFAINGDGAGFVELLRGVLGEKAVADIDIHRVADFSGGIFLRRADIDQLDRRVGLQTGEESLCRKRNIGVRVRLLRKQAGTKRQ